MRGENKLDRWVSVRLTKRDYEMLCRKAERRYMKVSSLIRAIILKWLKENAEKEAIGA